MGEGLLKKRINAASFKIFHGDIETEFNGEIVFDIIQECTVVIPEIVNRFINDAKKEIPKALIIGSEEYKDGYCHDDVWEMMEWIKKWFGK